MTETHRLHQNTIKRWRPGQADEPANFLRYRNDRIRETATAQPELYWRPQGPLTFAGTKRRTGIFATLVDALRKVL